jgi:hypothetical protein
MTRFYAASSRRLARSTWPYVACSKYVMPYPGSFLMAMWLTAAGGLLQPAGPGRSRGM